MCPKGVVLTQQSDDTLLMSWDPVESKYPLVYEVQYRLANSNHDYRQVLCRPEPPCDCHHSTHSHTIPTIVLIPFLPLCSASRV